jgi:hypothetical protein
MSWIGGAVVKHAAKKAESLTEAPSLEFSTTVSARGIAPANAVIEHLTAAGCRFRTVVLFDIGETVEFTFGPRPERRSFARGTIAARTQKGPRFVYRMHLDRMSAKEIDALARTIAEGQRSQAAALAHQHERALRHLPTTERLTRSTFRVVAQFPIAYRTPKSAFREAKANDISVGGMLMVCAEALVEGEPMELRFTLPSDVLKVIPEETVSIDLHQGTVTTMNSPRHPFAEIVAGARVVNHREVGNGHFVYGLAFTCIDGNQSEEIARYTHAVQRARNRH